MHITELKTLHVLIAKDELLCKELLFEAIDLDKELVLYLEANQMLQFDVGVMRELMNGTKLPLGTKMERFRQFLNMSIAAWDKYDRIIFKWS